MLDKGPVITFDSVQIIGKTRTKAKFLARYLQIGYGQPYSQQRIRASARLLRQLPYVQSIQPAQLRFAGNKVRLYYFLTDKRSNQLDGIIGFLPDPNTNKLLLTGEVNAMLRNITGSGKELGLQWRKVQAASQLLDVAYTHPNLLGSPLEFEFRFNLYKQDTTFLNLNPRFQFNYTTTRYGKLGFFTETKSSRYLGRTDPSPTAVNKYASTNYRSYGLSYTWQNLNDLYFPRQGWFFTGSGATGNKKLQNNARAQELKLPARVPQTAFMARIERYQRVSRNSTLLLRARGAGLSSNYLFQNELLRVGGLNTLRGFNEFEFYTSAYAVGTAEYRIFTGSDSYLLAFFEQGYVEQQLFDENQGRNLSQKPDHPFGVGAGISFSTGAGIFNFIYSIGQSRNQPFNFNTSKIHFGFTSRF